MTIIDEPTAAAEDRTRPQLIVLAIFGGIVFVLLSAASGALGPFIVALVVAYLMAPVVSALQRRGVPRWLGILLIFIVMAVVLVAALSFLIPRLISNIAALEAAGRQILTNLPAWLASVGAPQEVVDAGQRPVEAALAAADGAGIRWSDRSGATGPVRAGRLVMSFIFAPFFIFYVLNDARNSVVSAFDHRLPAAWRADVWAMLIDLEQRGSATGSGRRSCRAL